MKLLQNLLEPSQVYGINCKIPGLKNINLPKNESKQSYNLIKLQTN
jgi:hypothetical protein